MFVRSILLVSIAIFIVLGICTLAIAAPPTATGTRAPQSTSAMLDYQSYLNPGNLLGFMGNTGNIFEDHTDLFGKRDGLYFPYIGGEPVTGGKTVVFSAGVWMGGKVGGDLRVSTAEYLSEYVPGPMVGGTFIPDAISNPAYRVYKLYDDSLEGNPNQDYLSWPVAQGAPVDAEGKPRPLGKQTFYTVFNDADPTLHTNRASETAPLGIEVRQTVWGYSSAGNDPIFYPDLFMGSGVKPTSTFEAMAYLVDPVQVRGDQYLIEVRVDGTLGLVWSLKNTRTGVTLLDNQTNFSGDENYPIADGLKWKVIDTHGEFTEFAVYANGAGVLNPPAAGAMGFAGFPTPFDEFGNYTNPDSRQQMNGTRWAIHTGDNGTRNTYEEFAVRTSRDGALWPDILPYDYEIRFTSNTNWAVDFDSDTLPILVPFELWNIGINTPNNHVDDFRMIPYILDIDEDGQFNLSSYELNDHSVSGSDDDPYSDWIYWGRPANMTPGSIGYDDFVTRLQNGTWSYTDDAAEIMARMVFVNWNGGSLPPFTADMPEPGTVFRLSTAKEFVGVDTILVNTEVPRVLVTTGGEGNALYSKYQLFNKGGNSIDSFYFSIWMDSDIGNAGNDLVGCDTINKVFYTYNSGWDSDYGGRPPAVGLTILEGTSSGIVSSFNRYINGTDPHSAQQSYNYMRGLDANGFPLLNGSRYACPGDPATWTGDIDTGPSDRRSMASAGPFTLHPNDSLQFVVKFGVGQGTSALNSIAKLKEVLKSENRLAILPDTLRFHASIGNSNPAPQKLYIGETSGGGVNTTLTESTPWLTLAYSNTPTPVIAKAFVDISGLSAGVHYGTVTAKLDGGDTTVQSVVELIIDDPTGVGDPDRRGSLPTVFALKQNYPNPFNPTTIISYDIPRRSEVTVDILNILGQHVRTLVEETKIAGRYDAEWDGTDQEGRPVATGVYWYRLRAGDFVETKKMLLLK